MVKVHSYDAENKNVIDNKMVNQNISTNFNLKFDLMLHSPIPWTSHQV